ncbi:MAG: SBBP repeat-containing protein [Bacteroidetes bacterium]|nr:SBBP repeat-containing protein [Bacteroidota bacterium]
MRVCCVFLLVFVGIGISSASAQSNSAAPQAFSTYLGGQHLEAGAAVVTDPAGNVYVGGYTGSADFPTRSAAFDYTGGGLGGTDAFIAKFDASGALVFSTFLGGTGDESITALAVDGQGRIYAAGVTTSTDWPFPQSLHPYRGGLLLETDGFILRLNADGLAIDGTYLGGSGDDHLAGLALDSAGSVYLIGTSSSPDLPSTREALQPRHAGGFALQTDAFVARVRFDDDSPSLEYLTYLGGQHDDAGVALVANEIGEATVAGYTNSTDFPTQFPLQSTFGGPHRELEGDAFISHLDSTGSALLFSTYLGGAWNDQATGVALGADGRVHVTGYTSSYDFPVTSDGFQATTRGGQDSFIATLTPQNNSPWTLSYSTYLGGADDDQAYAIAVDSAGSVMIGGRTSSTDFPLAMPTQASFAGGLGDGFLARLRPDGRALEFATYLGGSGHESVDKIASFPVGRICATGGTGSGNFLLVDATQDVFEGTNDPNTIDQSAFLTCVGPGDVETGTEKTLVLPKQFSLHPNYPNPFNSTTTLPFEVAETARVKIEVFDVLGRRLQTLVDNSYAPGFYQITLDAGRWASGTYFYSLQVGRFVQTRSMTLVK